MAKKATPNVAGGLGYKPYNTKNYLENPTRTTGPNASNIVRDKYYGSIPTVKMPAAKTKKPAPQVISNVTNAKFSPTPTQNSTIKNKPPATRFGTVTGKTTGTRVSGGGGYGGGGTRGGGSLSGQGSGSRTAGTSRTGGTRNNDPVRG
jgi:hypothetical protein